MVRARTGALVIFTSMALAACTTGSSEPETASDVKASIAMASDPTTLDPQKGSVATDFVMARMLFDSLVRRDDAGKMIPGIATKWTVTATSAEFTLRDDVTCSDGQKVTADVVAASLRRFADPATGAGAAAQVFGAGNKTTVTAGTGTVKIELANPWSDLLFGLALPQAGVICPAALSNAELLKSGGKGAGSGPYYVSDAKPGSNFRLTGRPEYKWWPTYAKMPSGKVPTTVDMRVIVSEATMANELQTGNLDYAGITGADAARFAGKPDFTLAPSPIVRMMVVFNERPGRVSADLATRKAVAQAVDRKAFNQAVTRGSGQLMTTITDSAVPCASKDESLLQAFNLDAAKGALAGKKFKIVGTNAVAAGVGNEYLQTALKAAGAEVELRNVDSAVWGSEVLGGAGDWDLTILPNLNLTNLLTTPASFFVGGAPPAGRNFGDIRNTGFATGFGKAMATTDETAKCAAWAEAQRALLSNVDVVPLAAVNVNYITTKRTTAIAPDGLFDPSTMRVVG
jgi:peptide/nickel transport system substrate-binding protein